MYEELRDSSTTKEDYSTGYVAADAAAAVCEKFGDIKRKCQNLNTAAFCLREAVSCKKLYTHSLRCIHYIQHYRVGPWMQ